MKPEHTRAPDISAQDIQRGLDELSAKIKILQGRANATAADSHHTYHEHIAALEAKRAKLAQRLRDSETDPSATAWNDIKDGFETIKREVKGLFDDKDQPGA